jgi:hypothetical protein
MDERWNHPTDHPTDQPSDEPPDQPSDVLYSSSSSFKKTTTGEIDTVLTNYPELGYWRQKGLTEKQINLWMKTAECSLENMIQYLCYCRFEMVDLGMEESKPVKNVFNWFFKILERTGSYPKPKGYKSHREKQIDQEKQIVEQRAEEIRELKEIRHQKWQQQRDLEFEDIMADPECDLYKQCLGSLNEFSKKRKNTKGFEISMRAAFDKVFENKDEREK